MLMEKQRLYLLVDGAALQRTCQWLAGLQTQLDDRHNITASPCSPCQGHMIITTVCSALMPQQNTEQARLAQPYHATDVVNRVKNVFV